MIHLLDDPYSFASVPETAQPDRGQIWRVPTLYLIEHVDVVKLTHYDPNDELRNRYRLLREPMGLFNHPPVHELRLASDEELVAAKAKRRPVVVLSLPACGAAYSSGRPVEECYVVAPLYSFHDDDPPEFRARIAAFEYPWWIYLPVHPTKVMKEGFIRLERLQTTARRLMEPAHVCFTSDAMYIIDAWLKYHLSGELENFWRETRSQLVANLGSGEGLALA
jgi:hypothetical protein